MPLPREGCLRSGSQARPMESSSPIPVAQWEMKWDSCRLPVGEKQGGRNAAGSVGCEQALLSESRILLPRVLTRSGRTSRTCPCGSARHGTGTRLPPAQRCHRDTAKGRALVTPVSCSSREAAPERGRRRRAAACAPREPCGKALGDPLAKPLVPPWCPAVHSEAASRSPTASSSS